jgi:hypothetical protein
MLIIKRSLKLNGCSLYQGSVDGTKITCRIPIIRINTWAQISRKMKLALNWNKLKSVGKASKRDISRIYIIEASPYFFKA